MDATKLLIADHNRVKGLFARYQEAHEAQNKVASARLATLISSELTVHTTIEEEVFYPAIHGRSKAIAEMVDEGVEEHHLVKILLDEIRKLPAGSDEWIAKMTVIIENVEHHVEEEETEMFPKVRSSMDSSSRDQLGDDLEAKKAALGAPTMADKLSLSMSELTAKASEQKIPGRSQMSHEMLAATVGAE